MGSGEERSVRTGEPAPGAGAVAYIVSRFPKVTETFVLREVLRVRERGIPVELHPLMLEKNAVEQPEVAALRPDVRGGPLLHLGQVGPIVSFLLRHPLRTTATVARALFSHRGTRRAFVGALGTIPRAIEIAARLSRRSPDAPPIAHVHAHFANNPALAACIVGDLTGIPTSFTAHGSDIHRDQSGLAMKIARTTRTVMISDYNVDFVAERCGEETRERAVVIHCGIDTSVFTPRPAEREPGPFRILCVAALRRVKGHAHLLEAVARLVEHGHDVRLELIGDGPLRDELTALVETLGLGESVTFHGARPAPEVRAAMHRADVLCLTSVIDAAGRREGIPVTLMEAMACALPVVASRISGIPELIEHERSGLLATPGDAKAIATELERLIADPAWGRVLGETGRRKVQEEFELDRCVEQLVTTCFRPSREACASRSSETERARQAGPRAPLDRLEGNPSSS